MVFVIPEIIQEQSKNEKKLWCYFYGSDNKGCPHCLRSFGGKQLIKILSIIIISKWLRNCCGSCGCWSWGSCGGVVAGGVRVVIIGAGGVRVVIIVAGSVGVGTGVRIVGSAVRVVVVGVVGDGVVGGVVGGVRVRVRIVGSVVGAIWGRIVQVNS